MAKYFLKTLIVIFSCFFVLSSAPAVIRAQGASAQPVLQYEELMINSASEDIVKGGNIAVSGSSLPDAKISLSVEDQNYAFIYSARTNADANGNWSIELDQPLKSGKYYVQAVAQHQDGTMSSPVLSNLITVRGPFAFIIGIFSFLVVILLVAFTTIWYISRSSEIKRYRRILASQRDIVASYNILKKDVDAAVKDLTAPKGTLVEEGKVNEARFLLGRISENLEKMNKYVVKGVNVIGNYDIVSKIDTTLKQKK